MGQIWPGRHQPGWMRKWPPYTAIMFRKIRAAEAGGLYS